jgi:hypothetical protein
MCASFGVPSLSLPGIGRTKKGKGGLVIYREEGEDGEGGGEGLVGHVNETTSHSMQGGGK